MSAPAATQVTVPDIGDFSDVPIIEVHVSPGDVIAVDDPLLTLESDKATMDVPSSHAGTVTEVLVSVGDGVSEGTAVVVLDAGEGEPAEDAPTSPEPARGHEVADAEATAQEPPTETGAAPAASSPAPSAPSSTSASNGASDLPAHAGPSVRKLAREFGVDLASVPPSGPKGRITKNDLLSFVRGGDGADAPTPAAPAPSGGSGMGGSGIPEVPAQDFSVFGPVETQQLSRITRISGPVLHRSWLNVPHVTHNDDADITTTDAYRKELDNAAKADPAGGYRVTLLAFLMKAAVSALKAFPTVNSSLTPEKDALILKRYYHLGVAVDTPGGLVVPVIRDVDRKGIVDLSKELGEVSARARDGKLTADDMRGASFTISSLGGIGGTAFTPIVNAPEVAILGVVRSRMAPVWNGTEFEPRNLLPLCLSYDHRVIDGALAARFTRHLAHTMGDERRLLL